MTVQMPRWVFIRHGESEANAGAWFAGQLDSPLTELGRRQAHALQQRIAGYTFAHIFASDLQRARETAQIILAHDESSVAAITVTPRLRERSLGAWEGRKIAELEDAGELELLHMWEGRPPGGESLRDTAVRALSWCAAIEPKGDVLVVAHGALMRALIGLVDGLPTEQIAAWRPSNCEVVEREIAQEQFEGLLEQLRTTSGG